MSFDSIPFENVQLADYYQTHAPNELKSFKDATESVDNHIRLIIAGLIISFSALTIGAGILLASTGHLPHGLNALQVLEHATFNGAMISFAVGGAFLIASGAAHKLRFKKLNERKLTAFTTLETTTHEKLVMHLKQIITSKWTDDAASYGQNDTFFNHLGHEYFTSRYTISQKVENGIKNTLVLGRTFLEDSKIYYISDSISFLIQPPQNATRQLINSTPLKVEEVDKVQ